MGRKVLSSVAIGCIVMFGLSLAVAQEAPPRERGRREAAEGARERFNPEQVRQQMSERQRTQLGATEEEWQLLSPMIEQIRTINAEIAGGIGARIMRRPQPQAVEGVEQPEPSDLAKVTQALQALIANEAATADEFTAALTALREAREAARAEIAETQEVLRELVTPKQEAQLVLMGILD